MSFIDETLALSIFTLDTIYGGPKRHGKDLWSLVSVRSKASEAQNA
jgi:hypothetical protein